MSDQTNNGKNANENQSGQGMNSIVEFCQKNILYIAGAVVIVLLLIILLNVLGGKEIGRAHV